MPRARSRPVSGAIRTPPRPPWRSARLLLRFGRDEAGVRALQRVPARAPERRAALTHLVGALRRVGLSSAAADAAAELAALGGPLEPPGSDRSGGARSPLRPLRSACSRSRRLPGRASSRTRSSARRARCGQGVCARARDAVPRRAAFARLEGDVRALQPLDHPAIVPIRDFYPSGPDRRPRLDGGRHARADARARPDRAGARSGDRGLDPLRARRRAPPRDPAPRRQGGQRALRRHRGRAPLRLRCGARRPTPPRRSRRATSARSRR